MRDLTLSLLWPQSSEVYKSKVSKIKATTLDNLGVEELCVNISSNEKKAKIIKDILTNICNDEEVIRYRQDVFEEILRSDELSLKLKKMLKHLEELQNTTTRSMEFEEARLWKLFSRFKELEGYVDCVVEINSSLQGMSFTSDGLQALQKTIKDISEDEEFISLTKSVKNLNLELDEIQSITLGINLDSSLNPAEVTLVSVNRTKFTDYSWFRDLFQIQMKIKTEEMGRMSQIHRLSNDRRDIIMYSLYNEIEKYLKPVIKDLSIGLRQFTHMTGYHLFNLIPEITFYLECCSLIKKMEDNGMPVCKPLIVKKEDRSCSISDLYNINLALHMLEQNENPSQEIVLNDVNIDNNGRILILTGPNRGGKTVFTEAVGLSQILFQAGIFIPGTHASISPVDFVFTHFTVDENQTVELGRLGEETKRLNEIFSDATKYSLILLNESLSSTSFTEGLFIAQDVVKAMRYLGARVIFNTHMHELAAYADRMNDEVAGDSKIISMVTGLVEGKRSYLISPGAPLGKSYAMDIAAKFGISYEQIIDTIDRK